MESVFPDVNLGAAACRSLTYGPWLEKTPIGGVELQVRVCGWNVRWNDLSKVEQDHFIATAEAQE